MFYTVYTVQAGDSLYRLAEMFDTTVADIKKMNGLQGDEIRAGEEMVFGVEMPPWYRAGMTVIPQLSEKQLAAMMNKQEEPTPKPPMQNGGNQMPVGCIPYTVQKGDTFYSVAQANGTTVWILRALNPGVDEKNLEIGSKLCVPIKIPGTYLYTVRPGDSVGKVSQKFGIEAERLVQMNYLPSGDAPLIPGTQLLIGM